MNFSLTNIGNGVISKLIEKHLNQAGDRYLESINDTRPESTVAMIDRLSPLLVHVHEGATIVSIGVGSGEEVCGLYELFGNAVSIVGIDISSLALQKAKARLERNQFDARLINANATNLPFENESVDAVVLSSTLHEIFSYHPDGIGAFTQTLSEVGRVLKKDGVVFIRDFAAPDNNGLVSFRARSPIAVKFYEYFREHFRRLPSWNGQMDGVRLGSDFLPLLGHGIVHVPFSKAAEVLLHFRSFWNDHQAGMTKIGDARWKEMDEMYLVHQSDGTVLTPNTYLDTVSKVLGEQFSLVYKKLRDRNKTNTFLSKHFSVYTSTEAELIPHTTRKLECIYQKVPSIARHYAAAVIFDEQGRILLCRRSASKKIAPGKWHLPGGTIELSESPIETIERELMEELGLYSVNVLPTSAQLTYTTEEGALHRTHVLWVEVSNQPSLTNDENDMIVFVPYEQLAEYLEPQVLVDNQRAVLLARRTKETGSVFT